MIIEWSFTVCYSLSSTLITCNSPFHCRLPCRWADKSIIVMDEVKIDEPYTSECCKGSKETSLSRVRKVVSNFVFWSPYLSICEYQHAFQYSGNSPDFHRIPVFHLRLFLWTFPVSLVATTEEGAPKASNLLTINFVQRFGSWRENVHGSRSNQLI